MIMNFSDIFLSIFNSNVLLLFWEQYVRRIHSSKAIQVRAMDSKGTQIVARAPPSQPSDIAKWNNCLLHERFGRT